MSKSMDAIRQRQLSDFMLSLPTGMGLRGLLESTAPPFDPKAVQPAKFKPTGYTAHLFNIGTLLRNLMSSIDKEKLIYVSQHDLYNTVLDEIAVIKELYQSTYPDIKPILFYDDYRTRIKKLNTFAVMRYREPKTATQLTMEKLYQYCYKQMLIEKTGIKLDDIRKATEGGKALITTHYPADLLLFQAVKGLTLVESHTGTVKLRAQWCSKFHTVTQGNKVVNVPFTKPTYLIFGDTSTLSPISMSLRKEVLAIAELRHWHGATSAEKVVSDISGTSVAHTVIQLLR